MSGHRIFELGDIEVQSGLKIRGARLCHKSCGELNEH
jgi:hypothetical protein